MSEFLKTFRTTTLAFLLLPLLAALTSAQEVDLISMEWHGRNLVLQFSDAVSYEHDLAESDSSLALVFKTPINIRGNAKSSHKGMTATFDPSTGYFTLSGKSRIGYSTLWGPYSHALVVYTFNWDDLTPAEEEFHHGLLAMERGFPNLAGEYLTTARGMDTGLTSRRAESVLGVLYEQQGSDSLAKLYLGEPRDADTWGARAALLRRSGDTAAAASAEQELAASRLNGVPGLANADVEPDEIETASSPSNLLLTGRGIGLLVAAGIVIIIIATMFARRPPASEAKKRAESLAHGHHHHGHAHEPSEPSTAAPEVETSSPPPSPEEADKIIERKSSLDHIYSPVSRKPAPDTASTEAAPPENPIVEVPTEKEIKEELDLIPPAPPITGGPPTPPSSRQADELRAKVKGESAEKSEPVAPVEEKKKEKSSRKKKKKEKDLISAQPIKASDAEGVEADSEDESTIERARRMNLSRDHVELRERLRRDDSDA